MLPARILSSLMQIASVISFSRRAQRRNALLLAIALCLWLFAYATHVHAEGERGAPHARIGGCGACFSLPVGATPPVASAAIVPLPLLHGVVRNLHVTFVTLAAPSSYLSRGPPAL